LIVRPASDHDLVFVCRNMRDHSAREMLLTRPDDDREALARELIAAETFVVARVALCAEGGEPAAIFAAYHFGPSVCGLQVFSTWAWRSVAAPFIPYVCRRFAPAYLIGRYRMGETYVLADPAPDLRWFALCGMRPWGDPQPRGRNGELYLPMLWLPPVDAAAADVACAGS
jgi:hypothetical protein